MQQTSEALKTTGYPSQKIQPTVPWFYSLWKFSRPHTIIGTTLSVLGIYLMTWGESTVGFSNHQLLLPLAAWIACLCGNVYIVGLNQLLDIEIDRINKPHLPLAAGEFTQRQAQFIIGLTGLLALLLSAIQGPFLLAMVGTSLLIGTAYSLPPIRLKRFSFWAALCIFTVRGAIVNLGLFLHFQDRLIPKNEIANSRLPHNYLMSIPSEIWALTLFIVVFTFAIAIFKDIPDMEGDRQYNITTFTLELGKTAVFNLSLGVLTFCYLGMVIAGAFWLSHTNFLALLLTHLTALGILWIKSAQINLHNKREISQFYQFIWKLFFLEYLMFPIACLLA